MGNSFVCSASGERLVSAARDGDLVEARMLLDCNPYLSKYFTFGGLNSPLHFAAAKGHIEIVTLLLENGADVNSRNYCGQTALMQACRYGHWEVVQTLLLFRCNVTRADYLSGRTALHFAAIGGHVSCIRLIVADFLTSAPCDGMNGKNNNEQSALSKFVNRAGDGGITGLHTAALNGYFDCVQLLLDLQADVSAVTFPYGTSMDVIGAGSTPLHYAACGGNLKCCQILIARGGSCLKLNCIGLLPLDIAKMWGRNLLETLLTPSSDAAIPVFPPSKYLSLPLLSMLNIARDCGLQSLCTSDEAETCAVCLERACSVSAKGCGHELCIQCALYLCSTSSVSSETVGPPGSIPCPFCRHPITSFRKVSESPAKEIKLPKSLGLCSPCMMHHESDPNSESPTRTHDLRKARFISATSDLLCPMTCTLLFPLVSIPVCTCNDGPCLSCRSEEEDTRDCSSLPSEEEETIRPRVERTSRCLRMFWVRRSGTREHQCDSEINA